jgi:probable rRNA maturation factor
MITVYFQTESHYPVDKEPVVAAITEALTPVMKRSCEVSVTIVGDRKMKKLNTDYRQVDATTDVLSFPQHDPTQSEKTSFVEPPDNVMRLGDIVVSYPQALLEAAADNVLVSQKINELVLHGLNHLLGIHHPE